MKKLLFIIPSVLLLLAAGTLRAHQAAWERLTRLLMERESVDGEEVARCLEA